MRGPTQESSHLFAPNVTKHLVWVPFWRHMKGPTQERSHLPVPNVTKHWTRFNIWRHMKGHTQERSHMLAPNVTKHSLMGAIWRDIKGPTWETSHFPLYLKFIYWQDLIFVVFTDEDCKLMIPQITQPTRQTETSKPRVFYFYPEILYDGLIG